MIIYNYKYTHILLYFKGVIMKKVITCLIAMAFMVSCFTFSAFAEEANDNLSTLSVVVDFPGEFSTFFGDCKSIQNVQRSGNNSIGGASVVYDFIADEQDPTKGFVVMHIDAVINGKNCAFDLSGSADGMVLTNDIYWNCLLKGSMNVDGVVYQNVLSYMSKLDSSDEFVVTITPPAQTPTHLRIGELRISPEKFYEIQSKTVYQSANLPDEYLQSDTSDTLQYGTNDIYQPIPGSIYSIIGNDFTHFSVPKGDLNYYSQRARICYAEGYDRLSVSLKTYCSVLENYMRNDVAFYDRSYKTGIDHARITLRRVNENDYSFIAGTESLPYPFNQAYAFGLEFVKTIFRNALSAFNVPSDVIDILIPESAQGEFVTIINTNEASLNIVAPNGQYINFDNFDCGMPVNFQLDKTRSGMATYEYSTEVQYKTEVTYPVYDHATNLILYYSSYITPYYAGIASGISSVYLG